MSALVLLVALTAAGCGGSSPAPPASTAPAADGSGQSQSAAHRLRVGLTEWTIVTQRDSIPPGRVRLVVTNAGGTDHDLVVEGREGTWRTAHLPPGGRQTLVVDGDAGETLKLWCSLPGHEVQGMHTTLAVRS